MVTIQQKYNEQGAEMFKELGVRDYTSLMLAVKSDSLTAVKVVDKLLSDKFGLPELSNDPTGERTKAAAKDAGIEDSALPVQENPQHDEDEGGHTPIQGNPPVHYGVGNPHAEIEKIGEVNGDHVIAEEKGLDEDRREHLGISDHENINAAIGAGKPDSDSGEAGQK